MSASKRHRTERDKIGLIDWKFSDLNLHSFENPLLWRWWVLSRVSHITMKPLVFLLDVWTVISMAKNNGIHVGFTIIIALLSVLDYVLTCRYLHKGHQIYSNGDVSDTFADYWGRTISGAHSFGVYCLWNDLWTRLKHRHKTLKRILFLRDHMWNWRTLFFVHVPQFIILGTLAGGFFSSIPMIAKLVLISLQVGFLLFEVLAYPFVRCLVMNITNDPKMDLFFFCSFESDKLINTIIVEKEHHGKSDLPVCPQEAPQVFSTIQPLHSSSTPYAPPFGQNEYGHQQPAAYGPPSHQHPHSSYAQQVGYQSLDQYASSCHQQEPLTDSCASCDQPTQQQIPPSNAFGNQDPYGGRHHHQQPHDPYPSCDQPPPQQIPWSHPYAQRFGHEDPSLDQYAAPLYQQQPSSDRYPSYEQADRQQQPSSHPYGQPSAHQVTPFSQYAASYYQQHQPYLSYGQPALPSDSNGGHQPHSSKPYPHEVPAVYDPNHYQSAPESLNPYAPPSYPNLQCDKPPPVPYYQPPHEGAPTYPTDHGHHGQTSDSQQHQH